MDRAVDRLNEKLASRPSRRGFLGSLGKVALACGAALVGVGLTPALAASCCASLCNYGDGSTCPPWNCVGSSYCCRNADGYYGCQQCTYCSTGQLACQATWGPMSQCMLAPAP